uniref:ATPase AAA-type core domain-containing protein n=1 Tax=viral metagenome TaxID=1070528 RepID=A0A6C0C5K0_9ZZZZ
MKFLQSRFEDYLIAKNKNNLHSELENIYNNPENGIDNKRNLIFYGPPGTGKYTQVLNYIRPYSESDLKYERKITFNFHNKRDFLLKISDIHFEIDMELLGCNAKLLWNDLYNHILDILSARQNQTGIIVCKNFHKIHSELLDIFYSYLQTLTHRNIILHYIFITESTSFIPDNILHRCKIIPVKRPVKNTYKKCIGKNIDKSIKLEEVVNIKDLHTKTIQLMNPHKNITNKIIYSLENYEGINFIQFREDIYNIFIYHLDITICLKDIISHFISKKKINESNITDIYFEFYTFLKLYNNNYRPIYHLEKFMFYLCKIIHGL